MLVRFGSRSGAAAALWRRLASQGSPASAASDYTGASAGPPSERWSLGGGCCRRTRTARTAALGGRRDACTRGGTAPRRTLEPRRPARFLLKFCLALLPYFMLPDAIDAPRSAGRLPVRLPKQAPSHPQSQRDKDLGEDHARTPLMHNHGRCRQRGSAHRWFIPEPRMGHEA